MFPKQIFVSAVTDIHTVDKEGIGCLRWVQDANGWKCYRYVRNSTGTTLTVGGVYFHGLSGFQVTTGSNPSTFFEEIFTIGQASKNTSLSQMAGVAVSAIPDTNFGWVQIYGYCPTVKDEGTVAIAIGDQLKGVSSQLYVVKDAAGGSAPIAPRRIIAVTADGAGAGTHTVAGIIIA